MTQPSLIAITGLAGSGKSTIAELLCQRHGYKRIRFAEPLKRMLAVIGLTKAEVDGELKMVPSALLQGRTPRHAMQTLGTEWGRQCIGQNVWADIWKGFVRYEIEHRCKVVCDDLRFLNEAAAVRALGGQIWRVQRPGQDAMSHASETELGRIAFDRRFTNDAGIKDLHRLVEKVLQVG